MSKKRFKHKTPAAYERTPTDLDNQNHKVIAGFMEQQNKFCNIERNQHNKKLTREDIIAYGNSLADLYHEIQKNLYLLEKQYGAHFCFTAKGLIDKTEVKNNETIF